MINHLTHVEWRWIDGAFVGGETSRVNQIELFFSILQRKVVRNGNFTSREDFVAKLIALISD